MGKPYASALADLPHTYDWAMHVDIGPLASAISRFADLPLRVCGSGGSLTAAAFTAQLHESAAERPATATTPLALRALGVLARRSGFLLLSAGGRNPDVQAAVGLVTELEFARAAVLCLRSGTPLAAAAARSGKAIEVIEYELPTRSDGFLAVNSIVAFTVLAERAYAEVYGHPIELPPLLSAHARVRLPRERALISRPTLVALHGANTSVAAIDLESKMVEAGLGSVQVADYRNYAHGRHFWLAKHAATTGVIAFRAPDDEPLAAQTLALLPSTVPVASVRVSRGARGSLEALMAVFQIVGLVGAHRGWDPGSPGVPGFGRAIYHLRTGQTNAGHDAAALAIARKAVLASGSAQARRAVSRAWRRHLDRFTVLAAAARFQALVLDYDGTLCAPADRKFGAGQSVFVRLSELLRAGMVIGIATGRGKSVRSDLRAGLAKALWSQVVVGYYNGGQIIWLDDEAIPRTEPIGPEIAGFAQRLKRSPVLAAASATVTIRPEQVTIEPSAVIGRGAAWLAVMETLATSHGPSSLRVLESSHSIDVVSAGVSKRAVLKAIRDRIGDPEAAILCIGDRGRWPGNDTELLREPFSLSVDEVSPDPLSGWNFAPPGVRGVEVTLSYLSVLQVRGGRARLDLRRLGLR